MTDDRPAIRVATVDDARELLDIYAPYIQYTAITFEYEIPELAEFQGRIARTLPKYPYLVAQKGGALLGYAYAGRFVGRAACDWSAEASIYIRRDCRKMGLGKRLYQALEGICRAQGLRNLNASIAFSETEDAYLTWDSLRFHEHLGFRRVGTFHRCGYKFGRWYDLVWMEKMLGAHDPQPAPVIPFPDLDEGILRAAGVREG